MTLKNIFFTAVLSPLPINCAFPQQKRLKRYFDNKSQMSKIASMMLMLVLVTGTLAMLTAESQAKTPPIFNYSYEVNFVETFISKRGNTSTSGKVFYQPNKNRERVDWANGRHNFFCGSVLPNVDTPCISVTVNNKRWQIFPQRSQCCMCCTAERGCGILRPDWMKDGTYQGEVDIDGTNYDKFHKTGSTTEDYIFVTIDDQQIERRLQEGDNNGGQIADYDLKTFQKRSFEDSIFALPSYCHEDKPTRCPLTSVCALAENGMYKIGRFG